MKLRWIIATFIALIISAVPCVFADRQGEADGKMDRGVHYTEPR